MEIIDAMLRGGCIVAALILGSLIARRGLRTPVGLFGFLQGLSTMAFVLCTSPLLVKFSPAWWTTTFFCHYAPLAFWFFARAIFSDIPRIGRTEAIATGLYSLLVLAYVWSLATTPTVASEAVEDLFRLTGLVLGLFVMFEVIRQYRDDLIERRRKIRLYIVAAVGTLFIILMVNNIVTNGARPGGLIGLLILLTLLCLTVGLIFTVTQLRRSLFPLYPVEQPGGSASDEETPVRRHQATTASYQSEAFSPEELAQVIQQMEEDKMYRDPVLTISSLAEKMGTQEYLLRRIINGGLGQRNFTSFLNGYRLAEVEAALEDPAQTKTPILTLALEAGFNSIGPFNRAFKEKHGITPKEYRQRAQDKG